MKFSIDYKGKSEQRLLRYIQKDYSFDMDPIVYKSDFDLEINYLHLTVIEKKIVQMWGYCPYKGWIRSNYISPPNYKKGELKIVEDLETGIGSYGINEIDWPIYVNSSTGWVCIGNPEKLGEAVEFIDNCVAVVDDNKDLVSLWLKPQELPKL